MLLLRTPRELLLTPAGAKPREEARRLFIRTRRIERVVRETDARYRVPLRIGVADGLAQPKLSECFVQWRAPAPDIALEVMEMSAIESSAELQREEFGVGFSFDVPEDESIAQEAAWTYPLVAASQP